MIFVKKFWTFLLVVLGAIFLLSACNTTTMDVSTGRCIVTADGHYLLLEGNSPIIMRDASDSGNLFTDLKTGDMIQVSHDGVEESYPGQTAAYRLKKLEDGDISQIPADVIASLSELGYEVMDSVSRTREIYTGTVVEYTAVYGDEGNYLLKLCPYSATTESITLTVVSDSILKTIDGLAPGDPVRVECFRECYAEPSAYRQVIELMEYQDVEYAYQCANMRLRLPADWCYEITEYRKRSTYFGIQFWPESYEGSYISLEYHPHIFGVCGTGLEESKISLGNGYAATQGSYDGGDTWSYITLDDLAGSYVIRWDGSDDWRQTYSDTLAEILSTIVVADGCIDRDNAIMIAAKTSGNNMASARSTFDFFQSAWLVTFDGDSVCYVVSSNGDSCTPEAE